MLSKIILLCCLVFEISSGCPTKCRCSVEGRGRKLVYCEKGGMVSPIPITAIEKQTEVLIITAPIYNQNDLNLGPIFRNFRKLEEIHISYSNVPAIGDHTLWGLERLHILNLTHNKIDSLKNKNFLGAETLRHLDLSYNHIELIPSAVFRNVKHLKTIDLSYNRLPDLAPRIFLGLIHLERLDLSYNPLRDLMPQRFADTPFVKFLSCAGCGLSVISTTLFEKLPKLRYLDLRNNRLTQIPHNINILSDIVTLRLDGNQISFIEKKILFKSSLKKIYLSNNRIMRIEEKAFANTSLSFLDLAYNRIPHLEPGALDDVLPQLIEIKLSGNSIYVDELKNMLYKSINLRHLAIGDMGLTVLPNDLLKRSKNLLYLNISSNYLRSIPIRLLKSLPKLRTLDISKNSFQGVEEGLIDYLANAKQLTRVKLEDNPWHCDQCHVGALQNWLQSAPDQKSGCRDSRVWTCLKCVSPQGFSGTSLALLPYADLPSCYHSNSPKQNLIKPTIMSGVFKGTTNLFPHIDQSIGEDSLKSDWSLHTLFEKELFFTVFTICSVGLSVLAILVLGIILYTRHSAYYYTHENEPEKVGTLVKNDQTVNNMNGNHTLPRDPTIATIDELSNIAGSQDLLENDSNPIIAISKDIGYKNGHIREGVKYE